MYLVYMLREEGIGPVKIGKSAAHKLARRISDLQAGNPRDLILIRTIEISQDENRSISAEKAASKVERELCTSVSEVYVLEVNGSIGLTK